MQAQDDAADDVPVRQESDNQLTFHPYYSDASMTDLVLASSDGVCFRVNSVVLTTASSVFRQIVGVQRVAGESSETPVVMEENAEVLGALLDVFYPDRLCLPVAGAGQGGGGQAWGDGGVVLGGQGISTSKAWKQEHLPPAPPFSILRDLALAADKYDMPGVMRVVRRALFVPVPSQSNNNILDVDGTAANANTTTTSTPTTHQVLLAHPHQHPPVELYALARRLEWTAEARAASTATFACSPLLGGGQNANADPAVRWALDSMDAASAVLLLDLHARRRTALVEALDVVNGVPLAKETDNVDVFGTPKNVAKVPDNVKRYWAGVRNAHKGCRWNMYKDKTASPSRSMGDRANSSTSSSSTSTGTTAQGTDAADVGVPPTPTTPSSKSASLRKDTLPCREHLQAWLAFTSSALAELDRPGSLTGKALRSDAFWGREAFGNLWMIACPNVNCAMQLVSRNALKAAVVRDLDALPNSI